jgi:hypothetical protein
MILVPTSHGRRVPLYIWLPIVLACAAVGFVASTLRQARGISSPRSEAPTQAPVTVSKSEALTGASGYQLSRDQLSLADKAGFPIPAIVTSTAERDSRAPVGAAAPAPPAKHKAARARPVHTDRSVARARRPQPTAQQPAPAKAVSTTSPSLKNVPFFGPVLSLLQ